MKWVVRVVKIPLIPTDRVPEALIISMNKAGLWVEHDDLFDIKTKDREEAERLSRVMTSYGYNAVVAPEWKET